MRPADFAERVLPAARAVQRGTLLPVSFLIAQWAHETGWGESPAARIDHNFAGLKPWWGDARPGVTGYNRYSDLEGWAAGYVDFVRRNDLYAPALAAASAGRSTYEIADLMAPWVGQPGEIDQLTGAVIATGYGAAIGQLIRELRLTRYDAAVMDPELVARFDRLDRLFAETAATLRALAQDIPVWITRSQLGIDVERGGAPALRDPLDPSSAPVDPRVIDPYADRPIAR